MRRLSLLLCFVFGTISVRAELIDGPAHVRDERSRSVILTLDDSVYVEAGRPQDGWFYIERLAWVEEENVQPSQQVRGELTIHAGALLFDKSGRRIGHVTQAFDAPFVREWEGRKEVLLYGLTAERNIRAESTPERDFVLEKARRNDRAADADWSAYMQRHDFRQGSEEEGITIYTKEGIGMLGTADHRISLVFANEELVALLASRPDQLEELPFESLTDEIWIHFTRSEPSVQSHLLTWLRDHFHGAG